jgi:hypothetical protein
VDPESTKALLERIAFIRHTHYGNTFSPQAIVSLNFSTQRYPANASKEVSGISHPT